MNDRTSPDLVSGYHPMRLSLDKPVFSAQVDLGFRPDHLVPRVAAKSKAAREARSLALGLPMLFLALLLSILIGLKIGALAMPVAMLLLVPLLILILIKATATDQPKRIVRFDEQKRRRALRLLGGLPVAMIALFALGYAAESPNALTIAIHAILLALVTSLALYGRRNRDALPLAIKEIRDRLEPDETCVGDAFAVDRSAGRARGAKAVLVATDRRLIVCQVDRGREPVTTAIEYSDIARYDHRWTRFGLQGDLTLSVSDPLGASDESGSMTFTGILPSNLELIVTALRGHGVEGHDLVPGLG